MANRTPQAAIDHNSKVMMVTALTEVTFSRGMTNEQVIWRSFLPLPLNHKQVESQARESLRLGKRTWRLLSINRWSLRGW